MNFDHLHYVPCLRWKQGEYQAVSRLPDVIKRRFTPLIEVPEIGWDFENKKETKTIDEHLEPFAKRIRQKWVRRACFVDLCLISSAKQMATGIHPVCFVFDELRQMGCVAIPVTALDRDKAYQQAVKEVVDEDKQGVCLRLSIEQSAKSTLKTELDFLLSSLEVQPKQCDLILDLGSPNFIPLDGFSTVIQAIVKKLPYLQNWRTLTVIGTSFPETMGGIKMGGEVVCRYEWKFYKLLISGFRQQGLRLPTFGDYTISHPKVFDLDMRLAKPAVKIIYTIEDAWYITKGRNYKDYGLGQYHKLSNQILTSGHYYGLSFSWGDAFIQQCASGGNTSSLTMWKQVGTNHHITKITQDISSFYASSNTP